MIVDPRHPRKAFLAAIQIHPENLIKSYTAEVSLSEWHLQFRIPDVSTFSACVQDAISTGIITSKARREII